MSVLAEQEFAWNSVNNNGSLNFLVQQVGLRLYFYDLRSDPISGGLKDFSVDLNDFKAPGATNPSAAPVSMTSGKGLLFVAGAKIEPFFVEYDEDTDDITATQIYIQIRDFEGVDDGIGPSEEPEELTPEHHYNLKNQNWINPENDLSGPEVRYFDKYGIPLTGHIGDDALIDKYFAQFNRYPSNAQQWWLARKQDTSPSVYQEFSPIILSRLSFGNSYCPRGHFILDAFYKDRSAASGVSGLPVEAENERPVSISFFSGRVWYALKNTLYFSQILTHKGKAGFCYQDADPTSEEISDLVDTDGGVIPIPDMGRAVRLHSAGSGIMVFATNGIWFVSGGQGGFTATDFSLTKLSPVGMESPNSVVEADGQIMWWSKVGIQAFVQKTGIFGPVEGNFDKINLSEATIQTYFNETIPATSKLYVKSAYDPASNTVQWLWSSESSPGPYRYDRILNFDISLTAFYPWSISSTATRPYISGIFVTPNINTSEEEENVTVDGVDVTITSTGETVTSFVDVLSARQSFIKYVTAVPTSSGDQFTFSEFINEDFSDWDTFDSPGYSYLSFLETGYEILDDAARKKQATYVVTYFRQTEENYVDDGTGSYIFDKPSSCLFRAKWDFSSSAVSNKWSTLVEAYRIKRVPGFTVENLVFDNGYPVVVTKNKVRGTGRSIQFRFECSEIGKNFDLLGWTAAYTGSTKV